MTDDRQRDVLRVYRGTLAYDGEARRRTSTRPAGPTRTSGAKWSRCSPSNPTRRRFSNDAFIGAGGMGEVYRARGTRLDRTLAIKILPPEASADPDRRARFQREAKTVAGLSHPPKQPASASIRP